MADSAERQLKILLTLAANVDAGKSQAVSALREVEAQAVKTTAAVQRVSTGAAGQRITDTSIPAATQDTAAAAAMRAQLDLQYKARLAAQGAAGQTLVLDEKSVIAAELSAAAEAKKVLQMERQVILEIQLEAAEARIAGNPAMAAKLEREAAIRLQALNIQRATNVTMETAILQAERLALAQDVGNAKAAAGISFTRGQATALAQQLATGRVSAESISRSFSGFGTTLSIAGIAGFGLYQFISKGPEFANQMAEEMSKTTEELIQQVHEWTRLSRSASDFGDVLKLSEKVQPELEELSRKLAEFRTKELTWMQWFWDMAFRTMPGAGRGPNQLAIDDAIKSLELLNRQALSGANSRIDLAKKESEAWERIKLGPPLLGIAIYTDKVAKLETELAALDKTRRNSEGDLEAWRLKGEELEQARERLEELNKAHEKLNQTEAKGARARQEENERRIRDSMRSVTGDPFLGIAEKNARLIPLLREEAAAHREAGNAAAAHAAEMEALALTFEGELQANMVAWLNNFGTTADQVSGVITGTLNSAIAETSRLLTDAIFRTGDWEKAILAVGETFVQQLITMGIQMVIQHTLGETLKKISTTTQVTQAGVKLAAEAPVAAATSISSWGTSAIVGAAAAVAAIGIIIGMLASGGFARGGPTRGRRDEIAGVVHGEEYVFDADATRSIGLENLAALHRSAPHFQHGGRVGIYENEPTWTFGPRGFRGDWDSPIADSDWFRSHGTSFSGGIVSGRAPIFDPDLSPEAFGIWHPTNEPLPIPIEPDDLPGAGRPPTPDVIADTGQHGATGSLPSDPGMDDEPVLFEELPTRDNEWTTSPGDRRFLPSPGLDVGAGAGVVFGPGIGGNAGFLGPFPGAFGWIMPGTPPWDYGAVYGSGSASGSVTSTYGGPISGELEAIPEATFVGGTDLSGTGGLADLSGVSGNIGVSGITNWVRNLPAGTNFGPGSVFSGFTTPPGMRVIGFDTINGAPYYQDPTTGQIYVNEGTGTPTNRGGGNTASGYGIRDIYQGTTTLQSSTPLFQMGVQAMMGQPNIWSPDSPWMNAEGEDFRFARIGNLALYNQLASMNQAQAQARAREWQEIVNAMFGNKGFPIPGGADGLRLPGGPSRDDNILAWLSPGERVIPSARNIDLEHQLGFDWDKKIHVNTPRFAAGGRAGATRMEDGGSRMARGRAGSGLPRIIIVNDWKTATLEALKSHDGQTLIVNSVDGKLSELGVLR